MASGFIKSSSAQSQFEGETRRRRTNDADSAFSTARSERGSQHSFTDEMWLESLAHRSFGSSQRINETLPGEQALGVFHQRRGILAHLDTVAVEPPKQRRDRPLQPGEFVADRK